jgi:FKBP-type peptidyl-prolyl cis-trans isomerase FkpA
MIKRFAQTFTFIFAVALVISLVSCNPAKKYEKDEETAIARFLAANDTITWDQKASGLYYHEVLAGTGRTPVLHDTAYVIYTGKYTNGTVFDTNVGGALLKFPVAEGLMIAGFDEGITYMNAGGKATFLLPSNLAYGTQGYYTIPGYTPLVFDVELVKVIAGSTK